MTEQEMKRKVEEAWDLYEAAVQLTMKMYDEHKRLYDQYIKLRDKQ